MMNRARLTKMDVNNRRLHIAKSHSIAFEAQVHKSQRNDEALRSDSCNPAIGSRMDSCI